MTMILPSNPTNTPISNLGTTPYPSLLPTRNDLSYYQTSWKGMVFQAKSYLENVQSQLKHAIDHPGPKVWEKLSRVNQKLRSKGKAPINLQAVNRQLIAISNNPSLSSKQKKKKIENLRKQLGISKGEMKSLFTKRIGKLYKKAAKNLEQFQKQQSQRLDLEIKQASEIYGKNSPQVQSLQQQKILLKGIIEPTRQTWNQQGNFFNCLYPSFWSKIGGFFKKIGSGFKKIAGKVWNALKAIPILKPVMQMASRVIRPVVDLVRGKIGSFFKGIGSGLLSAIKNLPHYATLIPGIGPMIGAGIQLGQRIWGALKV